MINIIYCTLSLTTLDNWHYMITHEWSIIPPIFIDYINFPKLNIRRSYILHYKTL
jgi:hypothetical protein